MGKGRFDVSIDQAVDGFYVAVECFIDDKKTKEFEFGPFSTMSKAQDQYEEVKKEIDKTYGENPDFVKLDGKWQETIFEGGKVH